MEVKKEATEQVRKDRDALEEERNQLKADYCMLQEENRRLKTRGFFSRLFNRF
jgi:FtsZ-binding cell division protein ZapB